MFFHYYELKLNGLRMTMFLSSLNYSVKFDNSKALMAQTQIYALLVEQPQEPNHRTNLLL
jgi:hypothetical protein